MPVQEFRKWKQKVLLGASLKVVASTGQYENGPKFQKLAESTIHAVTIGILGVALIQTVFAFSAF
jgi:hypothetical protein